MTQRPTYLGAHLPGDVILDLCGDGALHILLGPLHHELHDGLNRPKP